MASSYSELAAISKDLVIGMPQGFKERVTAIVQERIYQFKFKKANIYSEKEGFGIGSWGD